MVEDITLLKASRNGDAAAFEQIVNRYQALVCAITFSGTGRVDVSEELAQETFLSAWKNLRQLKELGDFRAWLCTIARNMLNNYYRKKKPVPLESEDIIELADHAPNPSETLIAQEESIMLEQALMHMPVEYREPLVMYYRQEQSVREVAVGLGLNESTVRTRLHRARQMLREEMAARLERTLERTAPGKAFTKAVMAAVGAAGIGLTASADAASATAGTASPTGMAAIMSTVTAKVIMAAAVAAVVTGAAIFYVRACGPTSRRFLPVKLPLLGTERKHLTYRRSWKQQSRKSRMLLHRSELLRIKPLTYRTKPRWETFLRQRLRVRLKTLALLKAPGMYLNRMAC